MLRTVGALSRASVPARVINRAIRELRPGLDQDSVLSRLAVDPSVGSVRVREGRAWWDPASGQYLLAFEPTPGEAVVCSLVPDAAETTPMIDAAHAHYLRGVALEDTDAAAARAAYESCLAGDGGHGEARINLGRLLQLQGRLNEAEALYRAAAEPSALLYFNLGILLEDLQREPEAFEAYRQALVHDPGMADAHFNLSLLHERRDEAQASFRHLLAYRRLLDAHESRSS